MALLIKVTLLASIAALAALGSSLHAHAQGAEALDLQWSTPRACMSPSVARAAIRGLIRAEREAERTRVRVLIEGTQQRGYVARIEIARGDSTGERELRGSRCDELAEAAVLVVAMAIDPEGAAARAAAASDTTRAANNDGSTSASPQSDDTTARAPSQPAAAQRAAPGESERSQPEDEPEPIEGDEPDEDEDESEEEEPSDPRKRGRLVLGIRGSGDAGSLPSATLGGGLIAGVHWQHLRLELQALAYLPQRQPHGPAPDSATELALYTGAITSCFDILGARDEQLALGACAAVEAGLSSGRPQLISDGRAATGFWLAGFAGVDARQHVLGPLHLRLLAEVGVPVLRPVYEIAPFGRIFRASPVLGRFGISAFVLFP